MIRLTQRLYARFMQTEHVYMVVIALVIGLLGGLGAVGFRLLIALCQRVAWGGNAFTLEMLHGLPAWWKVLVPAAGGLVVGLIVNFFAREAKGHGVPEVMEAVVLRGGRIRPRVVIAKLAASAVCIGSGGSVGREGPIVQIGSSLGSAIGQRLGIGARRLRTLVGCGAAAGIAATFNAPVAGALFAVEIILGDFGVSQFSPIVISSVAATVVSHRFLGDSPAFLIPAYRLVHPGELGAYAALGVLVGLVALALIRAVYAAEDLFDALPITVPGRALVGGCLVGLVGIRFPEIFGVGYEAIGRALQDGMGWQLLLMLALIKIAAVSFTLGSGGSGGIFAPSLFIGAMVGGAVGTIVHTVWPASTATAGAYALVGMGGVVAAATHAPITAILIIFELTNDYAIILPLMITCIIATLLTMQLEPASIYTMKLIRRGIDLRAGKTVNVLRHLQARDVLREDFVTALYNDPLVLVVSRFVQHPGGTVFVVDEEKRLLGLITMNEIRPIMSDLDSLQGLLIAQDMMRVASFPVFRPDERLDSVMSRFGTYRFEAPVVEDGKIVASIWPEDVIRRYSAEVFKRDMASGMAEAVSNQLSTESIPGVQGLSLGEIPVPPAFIGRSVADLDIRNRFGVAILLVKRRAGSAEEVVNQLPGADYVFDDGDVILVMGPEERLRRLDRTG